MSREITIPQMLFSETFFPIFWKDILAGFGSAYIVEFE